MISSATNSPTKPAAGNNGFTLIEVILAVTLAVLFMAAVFRAMGQVQSTSDKIEKRRDNEKNIYMFYNGLNTVIKNFTHITVPGNVTSGPMFVGDKNGFLLLSKQSLIYPYQIPHFIQVLYNENQIFYREKMYLLQPSERFDQFESEKEEPEILLDGVTDIKFAYQLWDERTNKFTWKESVNSFQFQQLPIRVYVEFTRDGKKYQFSFKSQLND